MTVTDLDTCPSSTLAFDGTSVYLSVPQISLEYYVHGTRTGLTWSDSIPIITRGYDTSDDCGAYGIKYTYEGFDLTTDTLETFSITEAGSLSLYSTDADDVGYHTITATTFLTNYPTISASIDFIIKINAVVTTFTASFIPPFEYTISGDLDKIVFESFTFTTNDGNPAAYSITYTATLVSSNSKDDTDSSSDVDLVSTEFSSEKRLFEIKSDEVGMFKLRVTGHLWLNGVEVDTVDTTFVVTVVGEDGGGEASACDAVGFSTVIKEEGYPTFELGEVTDPYTGANV